MNGEAPYKGSHENRSRVFAFLFAVVIAAGALTGPSLQTVSGQTPSPTPTLVGVGQLSERCTVAPRSIVDVNALLSAAPPGDVLDSGQEALEATAESTLPGAPVDQQTFDEVDAAVDQLVVCSLTMDPPRYLALFSDRYLQRVYGGMVISPDDSSPSAETSSNMNSLAALPDPFTLTEATRLQDGRFAARVVSPWGAEVITFSRQNDRLVVDEVAFISMVGTPSPSRP